MPEFQTTVQDPGAILRGSGLVEISPVQVTPVWTDVGAVQGLSWSEGEFEVNAEENDNTDSEDRVTKQTAMISFTSMEPIRDAVNTIIRGSFDTRTVTAGALVEDATEVYSSGEFDLETFLGIAGQNGDGSKQTIDTVVGSVDGALAAGTGYEQVKAPSGEWGIILLSGVTEAQNVTVTYDYTPAASVKIQSGDKSELTKFMARITTKNDGNTFYFVGYYGNIRTGKNFEYPKDDSEDRRVGTPMEWIFKRLPNGKGDPANEGLLYEIVQTSGY